MARGFVTIIAVLSFLLLVVSVLFFVYVWPEVKKRGTALLLYEIDKAAISFQKDFGMPPPVEPASFAAALLGENERKKTYLGKKQVPVKNSLFVDFWRRDLLVSAMPENKGIAISSAGPDGTFGNEDDLHPKDVWTFFPDQVPPEGK